MKATAHLVQKNGLTLALIAATGIFTACGANQSQAQEEQATEAAALQSNAAGSGSRTGVDACLKKAITTADMLKCAIDDFSAADQQLNALWPKVLQRYQRIDNSIAALPPSFTRPKTPSKTLIVQAQQNWITLRDSDCTVQKSSFSNGSFAPVSYTLCRAERTKTRVKDFERIINETGYEAAVQAEFSAIEKSVPEACKDQSSNVAIKNCLAAVYEVADARLNATYKELKNAIATNFGPEGSKQVLADLQKAELAWIAFRDAGVEAEAQSFWGGTGYGAVYLSNSISTTIQRSILLKELFPANE